MVQVTDASEQPAKPARPTVSPTAGETTSLDVSWTAPDLNGGPDIIGYDVQYRQGDDGAGTDWPHGGTGTSTRITGLTADTGYQVRVRAKNGELDSDWSDPSHLSGTSPPPPTSNSAPTFSGGARTRSVPENSEAGTAVGNPVTATDADGDTLTYTLAGEDAASFDIGAATGQIGTRSGVSYNHEAQPSHSVTVRASDGAASAAVAVTISVTDLDEQSVGTSRVVRIPTLYGGEAGPDLEYVAEHAGIGTGDVIQIHSGTDYLVYMMGFSPGFPYLGGLSDLLTTPRLTTPRAAVPVGSVGIAETQTGVYPVTSPGGWRIIGRTPVRLFDPEASPPALLRAGDYLRFVPLESEDSYQQILGRVERGEYRVVTEEAK